jgi:predicted AlkP superfamily pyrophosphatase or phosphodiesterase
MRKIVEKFGLSFAKRKGTGEKISRKFNKFLFLVGAAVFLRIALAPATGFCAPAEHVVIVSNDGGGRSDVILTGNTPNIHEMAEGGAYTWYAQTINPSITLPSHCSMLTGCLPQKHGVTWNDWKPELGFVKTTTCFEIAKQAGMTTAMFVQKQKLAHIAKPGTVDKFVLVEGDAAAVAKAAGEYFREKKPNLLFVHFNDPDAAGHSHRWGSKEYRAAIENCDRGIGILRAVVKDAGVSATTVWIITADHGGHLNGHGSTDVRDMTIPWICYGPGIVRPGEVEEPVSTCDTAVMAVCALGLKPDPQWDGKILSGVFVSGKPQ